MAVTKEAIVIVLDVGRSMHDGKDTPSVLDEAKKCINMIIQRKIFSESKDEIGLVLFGISDTSNNLAEEFGSEYVNIGVIQDIQLACWELLEYVNGIKGTDLSTDFIDALVVAMDILYQKLREDENVLGRILFFSNFGSKFRTHQLKKICNALKFSNMELNIMDNALLSAVHLLENTVNEKKFLSRRILFLSCFDGYIHSHKINEICEDLKRHKIDLNIIGPEAFALEDVKNGSYMQTCQNDDSIQMKSVHHIAEILKEVNGESYSFSDVLPALIYYQKRKIQPIPWNATLDIGTNLTIAISAYTKVTENKPKSWKNAYAFKLNAKIDRSTVYLMNDELQTKVTKEGTISAFKYGTTLVPYSEEDKKNMDYQSGEKGMKVLGFTKNENVHRYYYVGDKSMYVFGQKNRELAGVILAPFIHALHETKMVAIVRYVYSARSQPKIGFLFPKIKSDYECLVFVALPFMEDLCHFVFTPFDSDSKNIPTDEQLNAIDDLITSMDLNVPIDDEEDEETLKPKKTVNPYFQRLYQCLQFKAFNPEKPLPEIEPHIEALVNPPQKVLERAETSLKRIKFLFPLKEVIPKKAPENKSISFTNGKSDVLGEKQQISDDATVEEKFDVTDETLVDAVTDKIVEVGSVNPVRDFQYIIKHKVRPFNEVCQQLMDVVVKFLQDTAHLRLYHSKILSICKEFRQASLKEEDCTKYNSFMSNLQNVLLECDEELWKKIRTEQISLISKKELPSSTISLEQAEMFLLKSGESDMKNSSKAEMYDSEDDDYNNLMDQL